MNPDKLTVKDWQTLTLPVLIERMIEIMEEVDERHPMPAAAPTVPASTIRATFR